MKPHFFSRVILTKPLIFSFCLAAHLQVAAETEVPPARQIRKIYAQSVVKPVTKEMIETRQKETPAIALGRKLFYDKRLSLKQDRSCQSCHDLNQYGTNGAFARRQHLKRALKRDVPSIYHAADHFLFNWDGKHKVYEDAIMTSLLDVNQMQHENEASLASRLQTIDPKLTPQIAVKGLIQFTKGLLTRSTFDVFLEGDDKALSPKELKGAFLFSQLNCASCHTGTSVGGQMLQKVGIYEAWPNQKDQGHFEHSGKNSYRMFFKVPGLRNVTETAPYFHDRSSRTIEDAIEQMGRYELRTYINAEAMDHITAFFKTITGKIPVNYIKPRQ